MPPTGLNNPELSKADVDVESTVWDLYMLWNFIDLKKKNVNTHYRFWGELHLKIII